jgi:diguanylate cyclase (GGDEF)-like protein/PAS domain S-box-containing protein
MNALARVPREIRWTIALGLLGLALAVPFSAPGGAGMQWDELVLACASFSAAATVWSAIRRMDAHAARPWYPPAVGAVMFGIAQALQGAFPGPAFDAFGVDDVLLFGGAFTPLISCAMVARRVRHTRWPSLIVDGLVITVAVLAVTEVLRAPLSHAAGAPDELRSLVLAYGAYGAVMLGGVSALCTVATRAYRTAATVLLGAVTLQVVAAAAEAMAIVAPTWQWTAVADVGVLVALQACALAVCTAPRRVDRRSARDSAPVVSPGGLFLVVGALASLPAAIVFMELSDEGHSVAAEFAFALVFVLMAVRLVLRVREDERISDDLVRNEDDFRELIEASSDGIAIMDGDFRLLFTSPAARSLLGMTAGDDDVALLDLVAPEDRVLVRAATENTTAGEGPPLHFRVTAADGSARELEVHSSERPGSGRRVLYLRDVTTRLRRERELERMAYTDHLTALPNRAHLFQEMAAPSDATRCLLVVDLDGFKAVNDVAGHEAGDQLLIEVARRLNTVIRGDDLVARLGGDEFAVLVSGTLADATEVAHRVVDVMAVPHRVGDWTFAVGASVGVATLRAGGGQVAFREADAALREAKQAGKGCVRLADEETLPLVPAGVDLDAVIAEGQMSTRLDAACDADGRIAVVHAVPVWEHPVHGTVRGQDLWGGAERQGRSASLQRWLLRQACHDAAALTDERIAVAISLPAGHVTAEGLATEVAAALADAGLDPSRLVLSFTEETLLTSSAALVPELEAARRTGVRLCLDNYGMGHSLFALLARISLDLVRVDVAALAARDDTERALQVLASIVGSTTDFGLQTIAGGISTPELAAASFDRGVDLVHGRSQPHDLTATQLLAGATALPAS